MIPDDDLVSRQNKLAESIKKNKEEITVIRTEGAKLRHQSLVLRRDIARLQKRTEMLKAICRVGASGSVIKTCTCGRQFKVADWFRLQYAGMQESKLVDGEMRHCPCGSTIMITTRREV
jgi:hypothetical protein